MPIKLTIFIKLFFATSICYIIELQLHDHTIEKIKQSQICSLEQRHA
jgi:hypothetical protein